MALGYFDGVHLGHQKVIGTAKQIAEEKGLTLAVMTFHPHPSHVLGRDKEPKDLITPLEDKINQIEQLGTEVLYVVKFNEVFASLSPKQFIDQYIIGLNVQHAVAGFDFTYGKYGKGTMETMPDDLDGKAGCTMVEKLTEQDKKSVLRISVPRFKTEMLNWRMSCLDSHILLKELSFMVIKEGGPSVFRQRMSV